MTIKTNDLRRMFGSKSVGVVFAFLLVGWMLMEIGVLGGLGDPFVGILSPAWAPVYVAILYASGLRNVYLPVLGNGILFQLVIAVFLYLEAVLFTGIYRVIRAAYRSSRSGKAGEVQS